MSKIPLLGLQKLFNRFKQASHGVTAVEYGLFVALIGIVLLTFLDSSGEGLAGAMENVLTSLSAALK